MSQSRFSIVLVGVSALLRRPLVSRLRPAAFTARGSGGFRRSALPSASAFAAGRVGLRAHDFRFSARTASGLPLGGLALPPSASEIAARWVGSSAFRFGDCRSAGWASGSRFGVALGELAFGLTASAFRHAPLRSCPRRVGLRAHDFRFRHAPLRGCRSASWPSGSRLPLFGMHRFGDCPRRVGSSAGRVGLRAHDFRFSARTDPHRRAADARADGAHRHDTCFTSKHLSQHVNLPHRSP